MTTQATSLPPTVKQAYERALRVPQAGRACRDPLGVWEDFFEQLHLGLTSLPTCAIIDSEGGNPMGDQEREKVETEQYAECKRLRDAIAADLERLPARDVFGTSNAKDKAWMCRLIQDFDRVLAGDEAQMEEVKSWLADKDSWFLNDFIPTSPPPEVQEFLADLAQELPTFLKT